MSTPPDQPIVEPTHIEMLDALDEARIRDLRRAGQFFWLDLFAPSTAEIERLGALFGFHELAIEDTVKFRQRPKIDEYGTYALVVAYGARADGPRHEPEAIEVHLYVHGDGIITVRRERCTELEQARARLAARGAIETEMRAVYAVLDALTDSYFPILAAVDDSIDHLEDEILGDADPGHLQELFHLKQSLVTLRRVATPQRDLMATAGDRLVDLPGLTHGAHDYLRDVYDHMVRISDTIDTYRDLLTSLVDLYLSMVANRQNEEMKKLTVIATIFLPLSFIVGFFGQNFGWMVEHISSRTDFLVWGIGGCLASAVALVWYMYRRNFW